MNLRCLIKAGTFGLLAAPGLIHSSPVPENTEVIIVPAGDKFLRWNGQMDRTYFIEASDPNFPLEKWVWMPLIEFGTGVEISHEILTSGNKAFFRLWYTDDQPPVGTTLKDWDTDGDGLTNSVELGTVIQTNPTLLDTDGNGTSDWNEDSDDDGIPDGWEAVAIFRLETSHGIADLSQIGLTNIRHIANLSEQELPAGVFPDQVSFVVTIPSTLPNSARPESIWPVLPTNLTFSKSFVAPQDLTSAFPEWHYNQENALVLIKSNLQTIAVEASCPSGQPVSLKVVRDPADIAAVGTGLITLLPVGAQNTATVTTDGRGSFYILGWVDHNQDEAVNGDEAAYVTPLILVDIDVNAVEYQVGDPQFGRVPAQGFNPPYQYVQFGQNEQDADEGATTADLIGIAGIGVDAFATFVGGKDGMRGTDRVMGGWSNNIVAFEGPGRYEKEGEEDQFVKIGFASNVMADASGYDDVAEVFVFNPGDPAPELLEDPILDRFVENAAVNGMNSVCLITGSFQTTGTASLGRKVRIMAWDSPSDAWPEDHPNYADYTLKGYDSATAWSIFLTFWSNTRPFADVDGQPIAANGGAGERTYQTAYRVDWNTLAVSQILQNQAAVTGGIFVAEETEFSPVKTPPSVNHETRPPTSLKTIHYDAR